MDMEKETFATQEDRYTQVYQPGNCFLRTDRSPALLGRSTNMRKGVVCGAGDGIGSQLVKELKKEGF